MRWITILLILLNSAGVIFFLYTYIELVVSIRYFYVDWHLVMYWISIMLAVPSVVYLARCLRKPQTLRHSYNSAFEMNFTHRFPEKKLSGLAVVNLVYAFSLLLLGGTYAYFIVSDYNIPETYFMLTERLIFFFVFMIFGALHIWHVFKYRSIDKSYF